MKAVAEVAVERRGEDLVCGALDVVLDALERKLSLFAVEHRVARSIVPIARLAPGASQTLNLPQSGELSFHVRELPQAQATVLRPLHLATHLVLSEVGKVAVATVDVPPGRYQVRLRMPTGSLWQEEVVVERDGRELSLHVSLGEER